MIELASFRPSDMGWRAGSCQKGAVQQHATLIKKIGRDWVLSGADSRVRLEQVRSWIGDVLNRKSGEGNG